MMIRIDSKHIDQVSEKILTLFDAYWSKQSSSVVVINSERWQSQHKPMETIELTHVNYDVLVPEDLHTWQKQTRCNLPWAEDHFQERVSGIPHNPPPSEKYWPFAVRNNSDHKEGEIFSHTYPERFWPKMANVGQTRPNGRQVFVPHNGIRYEYGDLDDVVELLINDPTTRQAYLPIWFPEDTGVVHGGRVPCSLGYHFVIRNGHLDCTYFMRSCDYLRHWADDMYMAGRLMQWVCEAVDARPRFLVCQITSLHVFGNDGFKIGQLMDELEKEKEQWGAV